MNKLVAIIFFVGIFVGIIQGKSSKKGLCIPPGTNFHCGDLAAFDNVRFVKGIQTWIIFQNIYFPARA